MIDEFIEIFATSISYSRFKENNKMTFYHFSCLGRYCLWQLCQLKQLLMSAFLPVPSSVPHIDMRLIFD
jgi:hypothetical protein